MATIIVCPWNCVNKFKGYCTEMVVHLEEVIEGDNALLRCSRFKEVEM